MLPSGHQPFVDDLSADDRTISHERAAAANVAGPGPWIAGSHTHLAGIVLAYDEDGKTKDVSDYVGFRRIMRVFLQRFSLTRDAPVLM